MRAPGGGASCLGVGRPGSGALSPPTTRLFGRAAGAHYPLAVGAGGAGVGTRHQPHSARSCELALRAVGAARGRPGGAPLAWVWGVRGRGLSRTPTSRPLGRAAGARFPLAVDAGCGRGGRAVFGSLCCAAVCCVLCALPGFAAPGGPCGLAPVLLPWFYLAACLSGVPRGPALVRRASSGLVALGAPVREGQRLTRDAPHNGGRPPPPWDGPPPPPPRHAAPTGRAGQGDSVRPPHPHGRAHSTWVADPNSPPSRRAVEGGGAPDLRRPSKRWKAPPPGRPFRHPHSEQRRPARAHAVEPVPGPHARTERTLDKRVAVPRLPAQEDGRSGEGQRLTPDAPHNSGRPPPPGDGPPPPPRHAAPTGRAGQAR